MGDTFADPVTRVLIVSLLGVGLAACERSAASAPANFNGDARHGAELVQKYQCGGCHDIPEIPHANGNVGPPLHRIGTRTFIAGFIQNSPDNMAYWIEDPQRMLPGNGMPKIGVSQSEARDIAAFLYTLK